MYIVALPEERARRNPLQPCMADEHCTLDNATFAERVRAGAAALRARGIGPGDVVAVLLPNRVEFVVTLFAAWRLGAAVTPVNPALTRNEVAFQITDADAKVVVGQGDSDLITMQVDEFDEVANTADTDSFDLDETTLALLIYTSGTTGKPKGVMLDHANLRTMTKMVIGGLDLHADDHSLLILPLFHVNGIVVSVLAPLLAGGRATVLGRFRAEGFFDFVERVRPTYFSAVPAIYALLIGLPDTIRPDTSSLRLAVCGAAPMPAELIARVERRFGVAVVEGYGLSEGTCASTLNPIAGPRKPGTVGLPLPGQEVALMDPLGRLLPEGPGEVVVRGPNVMRGYLNRPEETAATIVDGWLHTGDVGRFDEDGYLVVVDRIKDMIIRGGENLYPKEIENVLHAHPAVVEAAVVGAPDPVLGEIPFAIVTLRPSATVGEPELLEHCRAHLAKVKVPLEISVVPALPRNPVGKIDKRALRRELAAAG